MSDSWAAAWRTARAFVNGFWGMVEKVPDGRGERLVLSLTTLIEADRTEQRQRVVFLRQALSGIRDRYVKKLPGVAKRRCTLCGVDDGETHDAAFNCGHADLALRADLGGTGEPAAT